MDLRVAIAAALLFGFPAAARAGQPAPAGGAAPKAAPAASPVEGYPAGADVKQLSKDGSAVGPLDKLRVAGKYTIFDVYADWCGPCAEIDAHLRALAATRTDIAIRKLNVVDFDSPLGRELGPRFDALPYVIIYNPEGRRRVVKGADPDQLDRVLEGGR